MTRLRGRAMKSWTLFLQLNSKRGADQMERALHLPGEQDTP